MEGQLSCASLKNIFRVGMRKKNHLRENYVILRPKSGRDFFGRM